MTTSASMVASPPRPGEADIGIGADRDCRCCRIWQKLTMTPELDALEARRHHHRRVPPALLILVGLTRARDLLGPPGWCSGWWRHDGDVAGGIMPSIPNTNADMLMGIGGSPEAVLTAAALTSMSQQAAEAVRAHSAHTEVSVR